MNLNLYFVSGISELPLFDFLLSELFMLLDIKDIIQLFTTLLLEHQVLLYSSGNYKIMTFLLVLYCKHIRESYYTVHCTP